MSNSDDSQADGREKIYSVIWGVLIFAAVVWWFYPQIREQIQPNRSPTEIVVPNEVVEEPEQETPSEEAVNTETLTATQTEAAYRDSNLGFPKSASVSARAGPIQVQILVAGAHLS